MDSFYRVVLAMVAAATVASCTMTKDGKEVLAAGDGLEARLVPKGSTALGAARIFDTRDGVSFQMQLINVPTGTYRVALHEKGNCSSPNLFSAGPAWAPPGSGKSGADLFPPFNVNTDGDKPSYVTTIRGAHTEGPQSLRGRLVVVYYGNEITDAFPGQPNNRIACGVLQSVKPLF
jgi:Cu/Zn superoxide dismutase